MSTSLDPSTMVDSNGSSPPPIAAVDTHATPATHSHNQIQQQQQQQHTQQQQSPQQQPQSQPSPHPNSQPLPTDPQSSPSAFSSTHPPPPAPDTSLQSRVFHYRSSCLNILSQYQTHHLIPHSGKVVIFDSQLVVKHAFDGMVHHDLSCAPVWDSFKKKYVGLLSVSDFLDILMSTYAAEDKNMFDNLSNARICDWAEYKKQRGTSINRLLCISPEATLHEAVRQLLNYRVHRLCVVQLALADTVLRIITNHGILRFLRNNCPVELSSSISIRELGIGVFQNLLTLTFQTPVIKALELLSAYKVSSIPIVDENNKPIDVYSRSDVRYLALDQTWRNLDMTIEEALSKHRRGRALPLCSRDDSIHTVSGLLVSSMRHSLICVHDDGSIEGVVSLTDIFSFLLNSSAPAAESRIAALKRDYAQFEAAEAAAANQTTLMGEELLKQRNFLAEHGQFDDQQDQAFGMSTTTTNHQSSSHGEGDVHMSDLDVADSMEQEQYPDGNNRVDGTFGHATPHHLTSPNAIRPSKPQDEIPRDMDFLCE